MVAGTLACPAAYMSDRAETVRVSENAFALKNTKPEIKIRRFFVIENLVRIIPLVSFWLRPQKTFDGSSPAGTDKYPWVLLQCS
jgi:hypothetical protein